MTTTKTKTKMTMKTSTKTTKKNNNKKLFNGVELRLPVDEQIP